MMPSLPKMTTKHFVINRDYSFSNSNLTTKVRTMVFFALLLTISAFSDLQAQSIVWSGDFTETAANDGSVMGMRTATLSGDTYIMTGALTETTHFNMGASTPAGLTAAIAIDGTSLIATLTLTSTATSHADLNDVGDLTVTFLDAAFTGGSAAAITNSSDANGMIDFNDPPSIIYSGDFTESVTNDGSVTGSRTATLTGDTFTNAGGTFTITAEYTIGASLPAGLLPTISVNGAGTIATLTLGGAATSHLNINDVSDLTINFLDLAFTTVAAANIPTSSNITGQIDFSDPPLIIYAGDFDESQSNDGTVTGSRTATLTGDTYVNAGGALVEGVHFDVPNEPSPMTVVMSVNGGGTVATMTLTGAATSNASANNLTDLTITFLDAAFNNVTAANIPTSSDATGAVNFLDGTINYVGNFTETGANDGSVTGSRASTLTGSETFVMAGGNLTESTHYDMVGTVPTGLTPVIAVNGGGNIATLTLTGMATSHGNGDDVSDLTITFLDAAFNTGGDASLVGNSSDANGTIDFFDNNSPIVITNNGHTLNEGATGNIVQGELETTDVEDVAGNITYTIRSGEGVSNGILFLDDGNGIWDGGIPDTDVSGVGSMFTQADINNGDLYYEHDGGETTSDSFGFDVADTGGGSVTSQTFNFTVTAQNDDPFDDNGLPADVNVFEDQASNFDISSINIVDSDAGSNDITVDMNSSDGAFTASNALGVTVAGSGTGSLVFTGTVAQLNSYFNDNTQIQYTHATGDENGDNVGMYEVILNDGGNSGAGVVTDQNLGMNNIDVTAVNDAPDINISVPNQGPTNSDAGLVTVVSTSFIDVAGGDVDFGPGTATDETGQMVADFVLSDDDPTNVIITSLDIANDGTLTYTPVSNGDGVVTVDVQVQDNGGGTPPDDDLQDVASQFTITINDNEDPISTAVVPALDNELETQFNLNVNINEEVDVFWLIRQTSDLPIEADIESGTADPADIEGIFDYSVANGVTIGTATPIVLTGLVAETEYFVFWFAKDKQDPTNNRTTIQDALSITTTSDVTPPSFNSSGVSNTLTTSTEIDVDVDEASIIYYVFIADGVSAPTASQIKSKQDGTGAAALRSGNFQVLSGQINTTVTKAVYNLIENTMYDLYVVAEDIDLNFSAVETVINVNTPSFSTPVGGVETILPMPGNSVLNPLVLCLGDDFVPLGTLRVQETADGDPEENAFFDDAGDNTVTLILSIPTGFEFDVDLPGITVTDNSNDDFSGTPSATAMTSNSITISYIVNENNDDDKIQIDGLKIKATQGGITGTVERLPCAINPTDCSTQGGTGVILGGNPGDGLIYAYLSVGNASAPPSPNSYDICDGDPFTVASIFGPSENEADWLWYTDISRTNLIHDGPTEGNALVDADLTDNAKLDLDGITPGQSATFFVEATGGTGCASPLAQITFNINQIPVGDAGGAPTHNTLPTESPADITICSGESVFLGGLPALVVPTVGGNYTYKWTIAAIDTDGSGGSAPVIQGVDTPIGKDDGVGGSTPLTSGPVPPLQPGSNPSFIPPFNNTALDIDYYYQLEIIDPVTCPSIPDLIVVRVHPDNPVTFTLTPDQPTYDVNLGNILLDLTPAPPNPLTAQYTLAGSAISWNGSQYQFNTNTAGINASGHNITYTFTDGNNCEGSAAQSIIVVSNTDIDGIVADNCRNEGDLSIDPSLQLIQEIDGLDFYNIGPNGSVTDYEFTGFQYKNGAVVPPNAFALGGGYTLGDPGPPPSRMQSDIMGDLTFNTNTAFVANGSSEANNHLRVIFSRRTITFDAGGGVASDNTTTNGLFKTSPINVFLEPAIALTNLNNYHCTDEGILDLDVTVGGVTSTGGTFGLSNLPAGPFTNPNINPTTGEIDLTMLTTGVWYIQYVSDLADDPNPSNFTGCSTTQVFSFNAVVPLAAPIISTKSYASDIQFDQSSSLAYDPLSTPPVYHFVYCEGDQMDDIWLDFVDATEDQLQDGGSEVLFKWYTDGGLGTEVNVVISGIDDNRVADQTDLFGGPMSTGITDFFVTQTNSQIPFLSGATFVGCESPATRIIIEVVPDPTVHNALTTGPTALQNLNGVFTKEYCEGDAPTDITLNLSTDPLGADDRIVWFSSANNTATISYTNFSAFGATGFILGEAIENNFGTARGFVVSDNGTDVVIENVTGVFTTGELMRGRISFASATVSEFASNEGAGGELIVTSANFVDAQTTLGLGSSITPLSAASSATVGYVSNFNYQVGEQVTSALRGRVTYNVTSGTDFQPGQLVTICCGSFVVDQILTPGQEMIVSSFANDVIVGDSFSSASATATITSIGPYAPEVNGKGTITDLSVFQVMELTNVTGSFNIGDIIWPSMSASTSGTVNSFSATFSTEVTPHRFLYSRRDAIGLITEDAAGVDGDFPGCDGDLTTVELFVYPIPPAPAETDDPLFDTQIYACAMDIQGTDILRSPVGSNPDVEYTWYTAADKSGPVLGKDNITYQVLMTAGVFNPSIPNTYTVHVAQTTNKKNKLTTAFQGCEGPTVPVNITIFPVPAAPEITADDGGVTPLSRIVDKNLTVVSDYEFTVCAGDITSSHQFVAPAPVGGEGVVEYRWFSSDVNGAFNVNSPLAITQIATPDVLPGLFATTDVTRFFAVQKVTNILTGEFLGCISEITLVAVNIEPIPGTPSSTQTVFPVCEANVLGTIDPGLSGDTFKWYTSSADIGVNPPQYIGTMPDAEADLLLNTTTPTTITYFVTETTDAESLNNDPDFLGCETVPGNALEIDVVVTPLPTVTITPGRLGFPAINEFCIDEPNLALSGAPLGAGGVFTSTNPLYTNTGITDNGDGTASLNFANAFAKIVQIGDQDLTDRQGDYGITYTFTDGSGCAKSTNITVLINQLPQPSFEAQRGNTGATILGLNGDTFQVCELDLSTPAGAISDRITLLNTTNPAVFGSIFDATFKGRITNLDPIFVDISNNTSILENVVGGDNDGDGNPDNTGEAYFYPAAAIAAANVNPSLVNVNPIIFEFDLDYKNNKGCIGDAALVDRITIAVYKTPIPTMDVSIPESADNEIEVCIDYDTNNPTAPIIFENDGITFPGPAGGTLVYNGNILTSNTALGAALVQTGETARFRPDLAYAEAIIAGDADGSKPAIFEVSYSYTTNTPDEICGQQSNIFTVTVNPLPTPLYTLSPVGQEEFQLEADVNDAIDAQTIFFPLDPDDIGTGTFVPLEFCQDASPVTLQGRAFYGTDVAANAATASNVVYSSDRGNAGIANSGGGIATFDPISAFNVSGETVHEVTMTFTDVEGCENSVSQTFTINQKPVITLDEVGGCNGEAVTFNLNITSLAPGDAVRFVYWDFEDGTEDDRVSTNLTESFLYEGEGLRRIRVEVFTDKGCVSTQVNQEFFIGDIPNTNFIYEGLCADQTFAFEALPKAVNIGVVETFIMDFKDGSPLITVNRTDFTNPGTGLPPSEIPPEAFLIDHNFPVASIYPVELTVITTNGCTSTHSRLVPVLPTIVVTPDNPYVETFEGVAEIIEVNIAGPGEEPVLDKLFVDGWVPDIRNLDDIDENPFLDIDGQRSLNNTWDFGAVNNPAGFINAGANGSANAWVTNLSGPFADNENSWVFTPCFDITALSQPMVRFQRTFDFKDVRDGAVFQYSVDNGQTWNVLGNEAEPQGTGLNWYQAQGLQGNPGNQDLNIINLVGWGGGSQSGLSSAWTEARHKLDEIPFVNGERQRVIFRFAIGAQSGNNQTGTNRSEGFGIDDFIIEERVRKVFVEHFTGSFDIDAGLAVDLNELSLTLEQDAFPSGQLINNNDAVLVTYKTDIVGPDPINSQNPQDNSARVVFYGVEELPTTVLNGVGGGGANTSVLQSGPFSEVVFNQSSLPAPDIAVNIQLDQAADNQVAMTVSMINQSTNIDITDGNLRLYIAIVEKTVESQGVMITNLLRKLLPSGSGSQLVVDGSGNIESVFQSWTIQRIQDADNLAVVAWLQNSDTKAVIQAASVDVGDKGDNIVTAIDDEILDSDNVMIYPNPANEIVTVSFDVELNEDFDWTLYNQVGQLIKTGLVFRGNQDFKIETKLFPSGMYYLSVGNENRRFQHFKLVISH